AVRQLTGLHCIINLQASAVILSARIFIFHPQARIIVFQNYRANIACYSAYSDSNRKTRFPDLLFRHIWQYLSK
ncbi:hypothetical protein, partial [Pantoea eucrina]|uniref:hypothetical protein n=1 Tax=Pantoea eucrina TaxID=472693 RepID=UPI001B80DF16